MAAPTTTSDAWCMRTWMRLQATTPASPNHSPASLGWRRASRTAAKKAELAWPLGKLLVRGVRSSMGPTPAA